ncbi:MAG: hypothetical protein V3R60_02075, partial [Acidobacteriota bacterium]
HFDLPQDVYYLLRLIPLRRHDRVSFSGEFSLISPGTKNPGHVSLQKALPNLEINTGWQLDEGSEANEEEADK